MAASTDDPGARTGTGAGAGKSAGAGGVDPDAMRAALRRVATSVGVATAPGPGGPVGLTVNSVSSVTLDPPSILVCVNAKTALHGAIRASGRYVINFLAEDQYALARAFADSPEDPAHFESPGWHHEQDEAPWHDGACAVLACRLARETVHGTHSIFIGEVERALSPGPGRPLVYQAGGPRPLDAG